MHESKEYLIGQGGISLIEKYEGDGTEPVPQLPLSSYYGVLATAPTRRSPALESRIAAGEQMPDSLTPVPALPEEKNGGQEKNRH